MTYGVPISGARTHRPFHSLRGFFGRGPMGCVSVWAAFPRSRVAGGAVTRGHGVDPGCCRRRPAGGDARRCLTPAGRRDTPARGGRCSVRGGCPPDAPARRIRMRMRTCPLRGRVRRPRAPCVARRRGRFRLSWAAGGGVVRSRRAGGSGASWRPSAGGRGLRPASFRTRAYARAREFSQVSGESGRRRRVRPRTPVRAVIRPGRTFAANPVKRHGAARTDMDAWLASILLWSACRATGRGPFRAREKGRRGSGE